MSNLTEVLKHKRQELLRKYEKLGVDANYWSEEVNALFDQIREWLAPQAQEGLLSFEQRLEEFEVPLVGRRSLDSFAIKFCNGETLLLKNIGLHLGGAFGRLEIKIGLRLIRVVLNEKRGSWFLNERGRPRQPEIIQELNQENFEQIIISFVELF